MYTYSYYCCYRPPMPGGIPKGAVNIDYTELTIEDTGGHVRHVWGTVDYDRELTDKEISDYELEYAGEGGSIMDMREKVIHALGECIDYFDGKVTGVMFNEWLEESRKAIALLKAQAPKVMTLEEVDALGDDDIVWLECLYTFDGKKTATLKPAIYQSENSSPEEDGYYCVVSSWGQSGFYHKDNYMDDWRCWTSRPTNEQREAIPWN